MRCQLCEWVGEEMNWNNRVPLCAPLISLSLVHSCKFSLGSKINVKVGGNSKGTLKVRASSTECLGPQHGGAVS